MNATDQIPTLPALRTLGNLADLRRVDSCHLHRF